MPTAWQVHWTQHARCRASERFGVRWQDMPPPPSRAVSAGMRLVNAGGKFIVRANGVKYVINRETGFAAVATCWPVDGGREGKARNGSVVVAEDG